MQVPIENVVVRMRVRKSPGDLSQLMQSMKAYGQLSPIIVNRKSELIAGHRRLHAAKQLGWKTIDAVVVDKETELEKLEIEIEENIQRKAFSTDELSQGLARMEKLRRPSLLARLLSFLKDLFRRLFGRGRPPRDNGSPSKRPPPM